MVCCVFCLCTFPAEMAEARESSISFPLRVSNGVWDSRESKLSRCYVCFGLYHALRSHWFRIPISNAKVFSNFYLPREYLFAQARSAQNLKTWKPKKRLEIWFKMTESDLELIRKHKNELDGRLQRDFEEQIDRLRLAEEQIKMHFSDLKSKNEKFFMDTITQAKRLKARVRKGTSSRSALIPDQVWKNCPFFCFPNSGERQRAVGPGRTWEMEGNEQERALRIHSRN